MDRLHVEWYTALDGTILPSRRIPLPDDVPQHINLNDPVVAGGIHEVAVTQPTHISDFATYTVIPHDIARPIDNKDESDRLEVL
jgi:hypothetical protein